MSFNSSIIFEYSHTHPFSFFPAHRKISLVKIIVSFSVSPLKRPTQIRPFVEFCIKINKGPDGGKGIDRNDKFALERGQRLPFISCNKEEKEATLQKKVDVKMEIQNVALSLKNDIDSPKFERSCTTRTKKNQFTCSP